MIKIPDPIFQQSGLRPDVVPGMPVVVDVLGGKRTVLGYILSPIQRARPLCSEKNKPIFSIKHETGLAFFA
jgi:hypothetical protein